MYQEGCYRTLDRESIAQAVRKEGFDPIFIHDPPGRVYAPHRHPQTKLLVFLAGSMEVRVEGKAYPCKPGDKLIIPGNVEHSAVVGREGCRFFWSERL